MDEKNYLRRWFFIILAIFCIAINVIALFLYQRSRDVYDAKQWVSHTYQVITEAYRIFSNIQNIQTSQRGYLLTGRESFLATYDLSKRDANDAIGDILSLTHDNPVQQTELTEYRSDMLRIFEILEAQIETRRRFGDVESIDIEGNKKMMDQVRARHARVLKTEETLLAKRQTEEDQRQRKFTLTLFVTAAISAIGLLLANVFVAYLTFRRKSAEDHLKRTNKEMEGFTYIASHDLRSPLVNLKGFATEMKYCVDELHPIIERNKDAIPLADYSRADEIIKSEIPDALRYIHSSVEKMDKLTNAILELSRIGRRNMNLQQIDAEKTVRQILDTLHHTINSKEIKVTVHPMPMIYADQLSLEQVFGNVIDNAIKYLDPERKGIIEIGGSRSYRETKFWVKDNGRGISTVDYQKIFEIYRRAGNTETIPGEGMGMAYVRTTLRRLGGQIWVESTAGAGTTFFFTIPSNLKKDQ